MAAASDRAVSIYYRGAPGQTKAPCARGLRGASDVL